MPYRMAPSHTRLNKLSEAPGDKDLLAVAMIIYDENDLFLVNYIIIYTPRRFAMRQSPAALLLLLLFTAGNNNCAARTKATDFKRYWIFSPLIDLR